jgi:tetratricopeptide (TPR) repeat protein
MRVRCVILASVSSVFLAASAAVSGAAFAAQGNSVNIQAEEAHKALVAGDPEMAITNYSLAIDSNSLADSDLADALLNRALAHQQMGHTAEAVADYGRALKLTNLTNEQRYTALYNRGLALQKAGERTAAIDDFTSSLYLEPNFAAAYLARGNALRESGQNLFALSDYDKALRHNHPDMARVHYAQSLAYAALKRPADEHKALSMAVASNADFAPAKQRLAALAGPAGAAKAADPLLTASSTPVGGGMTIKKPELPQALAPPPELSGSEPPEPALAQIQDSPTPPAPQPAVVAMAKSKKRYFDRILPETEQAGNSAAASEQIGVSDEQGTEQDATTASIEPAAAPAGEAAESGAADSASLSGWVVQVASAESEDAAWSTFKKMQASKKILRGKTPVVIRADLGGKGIYYRVRFGGFDSQKAAQKACAKFKSGGVSCYVSRSNS